MIENFISPSEPVLDESACAFTGHRLIGDDFDVALLSRVVEGLVKRGIKTFYCGMAKGFDLFAAEVALKFSGEGARLVACIPYEGQSSAFSASDRERYRNILGYCSQRIVFSGEYNRYCMHSRDRYMVDCCGTVVCYLRKPNGGTRYTVNYARARGRHIIEL